MKSVLIAFKEGPTGGKINNPLAANVGTDNLIVSGDLGLGAEGGNVPEAACDPRDVWGKGLMMGHIYD